MRGEVSPQSGLFSYVSPERRIPPQHPLRTIKAYADTALKAISTDLDALYGTTGRSSIAPERLLQGQLLIADSGAGSKVSKFFAVWQFCRSPDP